MSKLFRSFKLRIFLVIFLATVVSAFIVRHGIMNFYANKAYENQVVELDNQVEILGRHLVNYGYLENNSQDTIRAELLQFANLHGGRMIVIDSQFTVILDSSDYSSGKYLVAKEVIKAFKGKVTKNVDKKSGFAEVVRPVRTDNGDVIGAIIATMAMTSIDNDIAYIRRISGVLTIIVISLGFGASMAIAVLMTKPITRITKEINQVVSFDDAKLVESSYTETEEIVESFNKLQARLKMLDESRQDFVSNVSHELKTPITSVKVLADSLNMQEDVPIEVYKEFMEDIAKEIDRENAIITDLLSMVNMDKGGSSLNITTVNVNEMLELIVKRLGPIARQSEVDLILESRRQVTAKIDEVKMMQAITNLVENAIKYNRQPGWVKVVLDADHQFMTIDISDSGIGIPEEAIEHIFERFYRVDKSHSREIGGTGLGLPITRKVIILHRGSITVDSVLDEGTMFTVRVPLTYVTDV